MHPNRTSTRAEAAEMLERYLLCFPEERDDLRELSAQMLDPEDLFLRSNMRGHITCSAVVLNSEGTKVLRVLHRTLSLWLPPGGHYEDGDSLWGSARREVVEETGVLEVLPHAWTERTRLCIDIDSHRIPANPSKREGDHCHHDFMFLATAPEDSPFSPQLAEVLETAWDPVADLLTSPDARQPVVHRKLVEIGAIRRL